MGMYEVTGKYISVKHGDIQLDGANPSAEDAAEETDEAVESGCDIVMAHRLAESFAFTDKKSYTQYLKEHIGRFKDLQFFTGENMDIDGMVALMEYRDVNGESRPVMLFFKHGLEAEKF